MAIFLVQLQLLECFHGLYSVTKHIALDCEMVGVGHKGSRNALARVALVSHPCYSAVAQPLLFLSILCEMRLKVGNCNTNRSTNGGT